MRRHLQLARGVVALAGVCVIVVLVSGFTTRSGVAVPRGWQRADLQPVTQPIALAGRFLFYDARDGGMRVVAVDARTGRTLWTRASTRTALVAGMTPYLETAGSTVVAITSPYPGSPDASISRLDARTGRVLWTTPSGYFRSMPDRCDDDATVVCVVGRLGSTDASRDLRFDLATGKKSDPAPARGGAGTSGGGQSGVGQGTSILTPDARSLSNGLVDPGLRSPEYLAGMDGSVVTWHEPIAPIFGTRATSDDGWIFSRFSGLGLFVGTEYEKPVSQTKTTATYALGDRVTAGLSIATGKPAWRARGTEYECSTLPCPREPLVGLRLRQRGTVTFDESGTLIRTSPDFDATLEAFMLATGKTIWRFDLGHSTTLTTGLSVPRTAADRLVLPSARGGFAELDLATGARHRVAPTATAWCRSSMQYRQAQGWDSEGQTQYEYEAQDSLFPCNSTGRRIDVPARVPAYVAQVGASSDGIVAWSDAHMLVGMPAA